ncbi:MAG: sulfatase [Tannerellaceae bacterium]|jgi:arylsulfatase|nr:sulfatase [Tannerellaceae bacterium]
MKTAKQILLATGALLGASFAGAQTSPNIVLFFIDDLGYGDLGVTGATGYSTPNIDRLAREGMFFSQFYCAQAVSSASRAGLLTGCYPNRIGISHALSPSQTIGIHADEETIAEVLKKSGYACGIVGKWHLGHHRQFLPLQNGFDDYLGLPYSNDMWPVDYAGRPVTEASNLPNKLAYPVLPLIDGNERARDIRTLADQAELTTLYTERAVRFIRNHSDKPFFLYVAHSMPHVPLAVSDKFKGKSENGLFGDVIMEIDWSLEQIMAALREQGLDRNTLVIFTSDNGPWLNFGNHAGSAAGMREGKGTSFEGGQRVACLMRWPEVIPAGAVCNRLASTIDILPTLAEATASPLPSRRIDGTSLMPLLKAEPGASPRKSFYYYYEKNDLEAVRNERFKLVLPHEHRAYLVPANDGYPGPTARRRVELSLFDLHRDPGERYDVRETYPEVVDSLLKIAEEARADLGDNLTNRPGPNRRPAGSLH